MNLFGSDSKRKEGRLRRLPCAYDRVNWSKLELTGDSSFSAGIRLEEAWSQ
jgi:hypothetical protein